MPSPHEELWRLFGSPDPTHTIDGSDGAMATSPMVETPSLSNTGSQVVPLFVVFQTPPEAVPTYTILGLLSTTAKSSMRPPITAGPISRNSRFLNLSAGFCGAAAKFTAITPSNTEQATIVRRILDVCFIASPHARPGILPLSGVLRIQFSGTATNPEQTDARGLCCVSQAAGDLVRLLSRRWKQRRGSPRLPIRGSHARLSFRCPSHVLRESSFLGKGSCCTPSLPPFDGACGRGC